MHRSPEVGIDEQDTRVGKRRHEGEVGRDCRLTRSGLRARDEHCGAPVGICGLIKREGLDDVDLGFAFLPRYAGLGYASESAAAVMVHGREALGIGRIVAITLPGNRRSIRVLEKAGLRFEKLIRMPGDKDELALYAQEPGGE